ncbi:retrovirus-related pol polyprotein from transposon TNT 1-94 [Tanacetum coccineum]|uniref:Retrovirus-related pol polyprotein from transposon TNT 1-94 n=1 Tax=Tanacetum coccineum TaxID=301880 RepID=A0ABQ5J050_9ASTR
MHDSLNSRSSTAPGARKPNVSNAKETRVDFQCMISRVLSLCSRRLSKKSVSLLARVVQFDTIVQFGTSLSSLAQSLIISLWLDPVDCHDYPSRGYLIPWTATTILVVDTTLYLVSIIFCIFFSDKEVNQAARDSDDTLVCCVENTVEDRIMDSGASFQATLFAKKSVRDVILKTSFGTSWTLKDVRYIPNLKRRLISVGQLDEEGYHVGFIDQQWKVTKGSLVVAHGNKYGSLYMVEDWWFEEAEESFLHNVREDKETVKRSYGKYNANLQEKCLKFDNGGEYSS